MSSSTLQGRSGGPGASAGTPGDQAYHRAIAKNPIDGSNTKDEFALENERELQRRIGELTEKVNRLESDYGDLSAEIRNWPSKLWPHVGVIAAMLVAALGVWFQMQSNVRDSLQPAITNNAAIAAANEAKIQAIDDKFDVISDRFDGLNGGLLDLRNALNELSKDIAVLNERAKGD